MLMALRRFLSRNGKQQRSVARAIGQRWRVQLQVEDLAARNLPSASPVMLTGHEIMIRGTKADDHVQVNVANNQVVVNFNGKNFTFNQAAVAKVSFDGKDGNDDFTNNTAIPSIAQGGKGNDHLVGGSAHDVLLGGDGSDTLSGGAGDDSLDGGNGADVEDGDDGDDTVVGGNGNDDLNGDAGDDSISGNAGADVMRGGTGNDRLNGGAGNDHLIGGLGADQLTGGSGDDVGDTDASDQGDDCENNGTSTELSTDLAGASNAHGEAQFNAQGTDASAEVEFELEFEHAPANTHFVIMADNVQIGDVTTSADGHAEFHSKDATALASLHDGTVISIQDDQGTELLSGTLKASGGGED